MRFSVRQAVLAMGLVLAGAGVASGPAAAASGKLVLYTSQPDKIAAETVAAFNKREPKVEVEIFRSGTTEIMNKIEAELVGGAPRADVLFIADAVSMEQLKADGRLAAYAGADLKAFPAGTFDPDKTYFGTKLITTGIIYNTAAARPTSWQDLLKPAAKGQVVLPSPLYSGAAAIHMAAIEAVPTLGTNYYIQLAANGADAAKGNGAVVTEVAGGQKMYGVIVEFMALNAKAKGSPVDFVFPSEGVSAVTEPAAILKTAHNPEAARAFIDFILSKEGQELAVAQGFLPARNDVAPPAGFPKISDLHILPVDLAKTATDADLLKRQFTDLFGG
ncbi:MAG TPA: ABC transporter substrate-binding protein [Aliidongia sp.]|uniref:ABC transporter substrate-binding protein n=1 Tax=Aliidongia sp. TaxID=1914230 RepID=UPI002DDCA472|nr:ABC transporter substrate-binding protein [Aliidongia sp.]HEV2678833.1 ABC transporter substrate-binding protein [Aliidongia sp.]